MQWLFVKDTKAQAEEVYHFEYASPVSLLSWGGTQIQLCCALMSNNNQVSIWCRSTVAAAAPLQSPLVVVVLKVSELLKQLSMTFKDKLPTTSSSTPTKVPNSVTTTSAISQAGKRLLEVHTQLGIYKVGSYLSQSSLSCPSKSGANKLNTLQVSSVKGIETADRTTSLEGLLWYFSSPPVWQELRNFLN